MKLPAPPLWFAAWACAQALAGAAAAAPLPVASPASEGFSSARLARLETFMRSATNAPGYLGAVTLIARHGKLVDWRAFGQRDLARGSPMARDSIFRIYSMTKTVATVALLMLMEEGRLTLEDPIAEHLPAFAKARVFAGGTADAPALRAPERPITIRHLLTHTAGFATGGPGMEEAARLLERAELPRSADLQDFADRVSRAPLGADPGTRFNYDGVNTEVLSRLVEVVSGQRFDAFLQQRIFEPLRMVDTGFSVPARERERIADLTAMGSDGRLTLGPGRSAVAPGEMLNAYFSGAGGLYSSGPDYLRFCQMLLNGGELEGAQLLGRKSVELMTRDHLAQLDPPVTPFSRAEGFGLGGSIVIEVARRGRLSSIGAFGWSGAASTYFTIDPAEQLIAILLMQHLPRDDVPDLPKLSAKFYNLVYQALR